MTRGSDQPPKPADPQRDFDAVWGDLVPDAGEAPAPTPAVAAPADEAKATPGATLPWDDSARAERLREAGVPTSLEETDGVGVERGGKLLRTDSEEMAILMTDEASPSADVSAASDAKDPRARAVAGEPEPIDEPSDAIERHEVTSEARAPRHTSVVSSESSDHARGELASSTAGDDDDAAPPPKERPRVAVVPSSRPRPITSPLRVPIEPVGQLGGERRGVGMLPIVLVLSIATGAWLLWKGREREPQPVRTAEKVAQPQTRDPPPPPPHEPREPREPREPHEGAERAKPSPASPAKALAEAPEAPAEPPANPTPPTAAKTPAEPVVTPGTVGGVRQAPPGTPAEIAEVFSKLPVSPADLPPVGGVGASGIHVDRITTGSSYDKGNCGGSVDRFSVGEHDVVNVCIRVVHPRTPEDVQVLWQRHGQASSRRGKVAIKNLHAYRTRAYLKLRKEYVGDWTVKIVSTDGVELASHDFSVAE